MAKLAGVQLGPGARLLVCSLRWPERRTCPPPSHPEAGKKAWACGVWFSALGRAVLACSRGWGSRPLFPSSGSLAGHTLCWSPGPVVWSGGSKLARPACPVTFPSRPPRGLSQHPAPSGLSCSVPAHPRHRGASRKSASTPGHGPRLFPRGRAPPVPAAAQGPSSGCCRELCMSSPYSCFWVLCGDWAD